MYVNFTYLYYVTKVFSGGVSIESHGFKGGISILHLPGHGIKSEKKIKENKLVIGFCSFYFDRIFHFELKAAIVGIP